MSSDISECTLESFSASHRRGVASCIKSRVEFRATLTYLIACHEIFLRWLSAMLLPDYLRGGPSPVWRKCSTDSASIRYDGWLDSS